MLPYLFIWSNFSLDATKSCLWSYTNMYVCIHPKHLYTWKYPKTTDVLTEIYILRIYSHVLYFISSSTFRYMDMLYVSKIFPRVIPICYLYYHYYCVICMCSWKHFCSSLHCFMLSYMYVYTIMGVFYVTVYPFVIFVQ